MHADAWWRERLGRPLCWSALVVLVLGWLAGVADWLWRADQVPAIAFYPWTSSEGRAVLAGWGVTERGWAGILILLSSFTVVAAVLAAYVILQGAKTWFRLYVAVVLVLFATTGGHVSVVVGQLHPELADLGLALQGFAWIALFQLAYLFPDGRFVPRWSRWFAVASGCYLLMTAVAVLLGLPEDGPLAAAEGVLLIVLFGSCVGAQVHRYRRVSGPIERQQTKGVLFALTLWLALVVLLVTTPLQALSRQPTDRGMLIYLAVEVVTAVTLTLIPVSIALAVLRHRLFEVDVWISRGLVYGVLTSFVVSTYVLVVGGLGALWRDGGTVLPVLATGLVAVAFNPLRQRVQRRIHHLVYGRRGDPYLVVADLGRSLAGTLLPEQVAQTIVDTIGSALRVQHVALTVEGDAGDAASYGTPGAGPELVLDVAYLDEQVGTLSVTPHPREHLSERDRELLRDVARQSGVAIRAASLTKELRRSRDQVVSAREEERRRLHRDLHDGLGPTLASLYQRLDAARELVRHDPELVAGMLREVQTQTRGTIAELRQLVYALRPPALDELGLVAALDEASHRLNDRPHRLHIEVVAPQPLPPLPAGAEVAAYLIAMEALTNLLRHADARHGQVCLTLERRSTLVVRVTDDGRGVGSGVRNGGGLSTMRERAEEVGGTLVVEPGSASGTVVTARLPVRPRGAA